MKLESGDEIFCWSGQDFVTILSRALETSLCITGYDWFAWAEHPVFGVLGSLGSHRGKVTHVFVEQTKAIVDLDHQCDVKHLCQPE